MKQRKYPWHPTLLLKILNKYVQDFCMIIFIKTNGRLQYIPEYICRWPWVGLSPLGEKKKWVVAFLTNSKISKQLLRSNNEHQVQSNLFYDLEVFLEGLGVRGGVWLLKMWSPNHDSQKCIQNIFINLILGLLATSLGIKYGSSLPIFENVII